MVKKEKFTKVVKKKCLPPHPDQDSPRIPILEVRLKPRQTARDYQEHIITKNKKKLKRYFPVQM
jgi:hypothetical protein